MYLYYISSSFDFTPLLLLFLHVTREKEINEKREQNNVQGVLLQTERKILRNIIFFSSRKGNKFVCLNFFQFVGLYRWWVRYFFMCSSKKTHHTGRKTYRATSRLYVSVITITLTHRLPLSRIISLHTMFIFVYRLPNLSYDSSLKSRHLAPASMFVNKKM